LRLADALAVSAYLVGCLRVLGTSERAPEPPPGGALARWEARQPRVTPEEAIEALKAVIPPEVLAREVRR
jgi:hypothetical protein